MRRRLAAGGLVAQGTLTDAVVLWAILVDDNVVSHLFDALHIDRAAVIRQLEGLFRSVSPEPELEEGRLDPRVAPESLDEEEQEAFQEAVELTYVVRPSPGLWHKGMHALLMSNVLNVLGSMIQPEIAVLGGHNGTPLDTVPQVLADRLASGEPFTGQRARLSRHRAVHRLDLESVCGLADIPDEPEPHEVLEQKLAQSVEDRAVLVLDHMEVLGQDGDTERSLLGRLASPGAALVLGLYEMADRAEVGMEAALKLHNMRQIAAHAYSPAQTKALLFDFYVPQWEEQGYVFLPDAFDSVIALEQGAWIESRRKALPYLIVGLAHDIIETVKDGAPLIKETAQAALDALDGLQQEWATTDERMRDQYHDTLDAARSSIAELLANPQVRFDHGKVVITRAHLAAQLICPNESEFHYPGHVPPQLRLRRLDDLAPGSSATWRSLLPLTDAHSD